jgi:hypothetical protein
MANGRLATAIPIWMRVPGIIALVLVGIVVSTMLVGAAGIGDRAGTARHEPGQNQNQQQMGPGHGGGTGGGHRPPTGRH